MMDDGRLSDSRGDDGFSFGDFVRGGAVVLDTIAGRDNPDDLRLELSSTGARDSSRPFAWKNVAGEADFADTLDRVSASEAPDGERASLAWKNIGDVGGSSVVE